MSKQLLLGDEAIAQAALDAGLSGVYAYPGTPSTEITEYIQMAPITAEKNIHNRWCSNEKTAMEAALGMSFAGKRSLVCMKHVGMNVAADCFINSAITGVKGGLIIIAADDPSMHSSQNEQDSRFYGDFSLIPMYEPNNQQEAYDMVYNGFNFSEQTGEPILMRMVTRLAHSRSGVERKEQQPQNEISFSEDPRQFILLPGNARKRYKALLQRQDEFIKASENSAYNKYTDGPNKKLGIVACGIGYNYLMENYPEGCEYPVLKIGQYPLPKKQLMQLVEACDEILVLEDGQPFVEKQLKGYLGIGIKVKGRLDGTLSQDGELNPDSVARAVGKENKAEFSVPSLVEMRPPALCEGCGHRDMYTVLTQVLKEEYPTYKVFSDIGCYTLGAGHPWNALDTCVSMGASMGMALGLDKGRGEADKDKRIVAVIGDSTFLHMGMQGLLDMVYNKGNVTVLLLDNRAVGMTGGQDNPGNGRDIYGDDAPRVDFAKLVAALGVKEERIHTVNPYELPVLFKTIRDEVKVPEVSVIITDQPCVLIKDYHKMKPYEVIDDKCTGCGNCIDVGCPAIHVTRRGKEVKASGREVDLAFVRIESSVCTGCGLCVQPCAPDAIVHYAPVSPIKLINMGCGS